MHVINARNVNEALYIGSILLNSCDKETTSRVGNVVEYPEPVATVYHRPFERCVFLERRDWNPFFALFEALWILAGREDLPFLARFNAGMKMFSDDGETFHAPYGFRLRKQLGFDQLERVVKELSDDMGSRRAVATIWNSSIDLNTDSTDLPCNDMLMFKVRDGALRMTVCNRSNDMILGAYNVNHFQFSFIQEYIAARLGVPMGWYTHVSDSFHAYVDNPMFDSIVKSQDWLPPTNYEDGLTRRPVFGGRDVEEFMLDLELFFTLWDYTRREKEEDFLFGVQFRSPYMEEVVMPMYQAHWMHKYNKETASAIGLCKNIQQEDLQLACKLWLKRRIK